MPEPEQPQSDEGAPQNAEEADAPANPCPMVADVFRPRQEDLGEISART